ncbi:uncharacterized protein CTRU02_201114 [Colletotrichum truncatum]|uniref:Uncharacterized protein n=1 Tax=Colletotrichum truncatum TaxID=5467 RepID=A0ACC3ZHA9_COLTU
MASAKTYGNSHRTKSMSFSSYSILASISTHSQFYLQKQTFFSSISASSLMNAFAN